MGIHEWLGLIGQEGVARVVYHCQLASVPGLSRSVCVLIMLMRQTFEACLGRPGMIHHVRVGQWYMVGPIISTVGQYLSRTPWNKCHVVIF